MATFCTKCGRPIDPGTAFCTACGTPVGAAPSAPSVPVQAGYSQVPQAYAPQQAYAPPLPPQGPPQPGYAQPQGYAAQPFVAPLPVQGYPPPGAKSSGGGATKIILIVVAVIVLLIVLAGAVGVFVLHKVKQAVHVDSKDGGMSVSVPGGGSFGVGAEMKFTEEELGVPIYPGAETSSGGMRIKNAGGSMVTALFKSNDDTDTILAFYRSKMPGADEAQVNNGTMLKTGDKDTAQTMVTITPHTGDTDAKNDIMVMRIIGGK